MLLKKKQKKKRKGKTVHLCLPQQASLKNKCTRVPVVLLVLEKRWFYLRLP